jgi:flagellar basal body L-ring protein FlgH
MTISNNIYVALAVAAVTLTSACGSQPTKSSSTEKLSDARNAVEYVMVGQPAGQSIEQKDAFQYCINKLNEERRAAYDASNQNEPLYLARAEDSAIVSRSEYEMQRQRNSNMVINFMSLGVGKLFTQSDEEVDKQTIGTNAPPAVRQSMQTYVYTCFQNRQMEIYKKQFNQ